MDRYDGIFFLNSEIENPLISSYWMEFFSFYRKQAERIRV